MKNTQYESPIQNLLETMKTNFANTVNPKGSLEIEQLIVDGFLADQAKKDFQNMTEQTTQQETCKKISTRWNGSGEYSYLGCIIWKHGDGHWEISKDTIDGNAVGAMFTTKREAKRHVRWLWEESK